MPGCNPTFGPTCIVIVDYYFSIGFENLSTSIFLFCIVFAIPSKQIDGVVTFPVDNT